MMSNYKLARTFGRCKKQTQRARTCGRCKKQTTTSKNNWPLQKANDNEQEHMAAANGKVEDASNL